MKKMRIIMLIAAFGIIFGSVSASFGQIKVGGYRSVSVEDVGVVAAAEFAVQSRSETEEMAMSVESIRKAEVQVVQGFNYKLCIEVYYPSSEPETDGVLIFAQAVVYKDLKGKLKLSSWAEADCAPQE